MDSGVYGLYCRATGKWYVGASTQIHKRLKEHKKALRRALHCKLEIQQANCHRMGVDAARYGLRSIQAIVLEYVDGSDNLGDREIYWVKELGAVDNGYNRHIPFPDRRWNDG